ncbi:MAG: NADH-quinone oxidoreductase subunit J [Chloroflexi bacterium]|nr:NADH-quinone oxidoreductase subunit J [Chloroflexota bacterium]
MNEVIYTAAFYVFGAAVLVGAIGTVAARRLIHNALFLVLALASAAAIYVLLSADFVAVVQILVYTGAIMILLLFALMLTPQQVELPATAPAGQQLAAGLVAVALFALIVAAVLTGPWRQAATPLNAPTSTPLGTALLTTYVFPFELVSLVLLVALIGALLLAREG